MLKDFDQKGILAHYRTPQALSLVLGDERTDDAAYLDACRMKHNTLEYDMAGVITQNDTDELVEFVLDLRDNVINWLKDQHNDLMKNDHKINAK